MNKRPTKKQWNKLLNKMPCENVSLNSDGTYNTSKAPDFRKWLKDG